MVDEGTITHFFLTFFCFCLLIIIPPLLHILLSPETHGSPDQGACPLGHYAADFINDLPLGCLQAHLGEVTVWPQ
jgi:hypothetical protein